MVDVNPLGPMMHLKEIEREALALRTATAKGRSGVLDTALARTVKSVKWLISLKAMNVGDSANVGNEANPAGPLP